MVAKRAWTPEAYLAKSRLASAGRTLAVLETRLGELANTDTDEGRQARAELAAQRQEVERARVHWEAERYISTLVMALEAPAPALSNEQIERVTALAVHLVPARFRSGNEEGSGS